MKVLYVVAKGKKIVTGEYDKKQDAKKVRRDLNGVDDEGNEVFATGYRVARGWDHYKGTTV